ncbi:GNAT family N-acetyltransferase [Thalassospira lucentensis]|uniref:GNAT family N-acetyltransferase n=1 Tax=Thalassospira lucentensis TaxID=168935 RepID=UPI003AA82AD3
MLGFLGAIREVYPGGSEWLDQSLKMEVKETYVLALLSPLNELAGAAILKKKYLRSMKICTFYIRPQFRKLGIGQRAVREICLRSFDSGFDHLYVTYSKNHASCVGGFLEDNGFEYQSEIYDKYSVGDSEIVFGIGS